MALTNQSKILVTGAGGFIGRSVTKELLRKGLEVVALVRRTSDITHSHQNLRWVIGDVRNRNDLIESLRGIDIVVHLAGAKADEKDSYAINVTGAKNIIEICEINKVKGLVNVSTASTKLAHRGIYGSTKAAADKIFMSGNLPVVTLHLSVVYSDLNSGIFGTIARVSKLPIIPVLGAGTFTMRPIHVDDVAGAISKIISEPIHGRMQYDLGGRDTVSLNELVNMIVSNVRGKSPRLVHFPVFFGFVAAKIFKLMFKNPPLTTSNILAMYQGAEIVPEPFFKKYNFEPRSLQAGLQSLVQKREQREIEAEAVIRYCLSLAPQRISQISDLTANYHRAICLNSLEAHRVQSWILGNNIFIGGLDALTKFVRPNGIFQKKLVVAATLVECSTASSQWLLPKNVSLPRLFMRLSWTGLRAAAKLAVGIVLLCIPGLIKHNA